MLWGRVFENVRTLEYITTKRVNELLLRKKLQAQVTAVSEFLKHGYRYLLNTHDDVALNSRRAHVRSNGAPQNNDVTFHETKNDECLKPCQVIDNIRSNVNVSEDGVDNLLSDCEMKFRFYMAHQLFYHVQQSVF